MMASYNLRLPIPGIRFTIYNKIVRQQSEATTALWLTLFIGGRRIIPLQGLTFVDILTVKHRRTQLREAPQRIKIKFLNKNE